MFGSTDTAAQAAHRLRQGTGAPAQAAHRLRRRTGSGGAPAQAVMSFAVNRAQAAEPNTATYSPCNPMFLINWSQ
ncbi:hypothetical protein TPA0910_49120 [Streptomyces hygroscopicus subsp. sporocinereus]|uniref:Uncharacterized protein n=1 Tax=Streptomyces hygroscopicus TaxID=1912 RepID=A0ABQ3U4E6_STRHY|nr:hypothetical protein TPA0910_49120 [Streptomyces hygroscopicus]